MPCWENGDKEEQGLITIKRILLVMLLHLFLFAGPAPAKENINIAVAANFITAFKEIAWSFEAKTGISVEATYSSTGQIYAQIMSGAPYDLFLSADQEKPELLHRAGRADIPFVYATGQVVLWTTRHDLCGAGNWREVLAKPGLKKIAVANPKTAPYGAAATDPLRKAGILEHVQGKLVYAQTIAQTFQYAATGSVDAGFCALSSTLSEEGRKGCFFSVDEAPPIVQSACLLKRTTRKKATEEFIRFLSSPEADSVKKKYGYR
jgi:molybdate transport system substrate-binding protein